MSAERLTPLDASFLHMEDSASHMHVACVMVFAGAPPGYEQLLKHLDARLHLVPRYRKRLATVPFGQGRPRWVDDEDFDLRFHVRRTALPAPGTESELRVLAGRVFSQPLRRDRPLWEIWLVEGLSERRFALLSKTHHALVDGISGLDILSVLFAPEEAERAAGEWYPTPAPSSVQLLAESLLERATVPAEGFRALRAVVRRPRRLGGEVLLKLRAMSAFAAAGLSPAPVTPFNDTLVGPDRRFTWVRMSLSEVKEIKGALGVTVNDCVLAIVSGALRRYLLRKGVEVDGMTLKALVPVSLRAEDQRDGMGNRVSGMIAPLPVSCADPLASVRSIAARMDRVKASGQAVGAQALTELSGFAPANLLGQAGRVSLRQRLINLVVTNVPGPQHPLMMEGRELLDIFPMVPLGSNLTLGIAIVSYNGTLNFGLVGDFKVMHDLEALGEDLRAAAAELADAAVTSSDALSAAAPHRPRSPSREPWPGYDRLSVARVAERLRNADGSLLRRAHRYELAHKRRKGILKLTASEPSRS